MDYFCFIIDAEGIWCSEKWVARVQGLRLQGEFGGQKIPFPILEGPCDSFQSKLSSTKMGGLTTYLDEHQYTLYKRGQVTPSHRRITAVVLENCNNFSYHVLIIFVYHVTYMLY